MNAVKRFWRWLGGLADFEFERVEQLNAAGVERFITQVERLHLEPGDGLVITTKQGLSPTQASELKKFLDTYLEKVTGEKHPILVLKGGMGMKVVSGPRPAPTVES